MWRLIGVVSIASIAACARKPVSDQVNPDLALCPSLSMEECRKAAECSVVSGTRYDSGQQCSHPLEEVGCQHGTCGDGSLTYAIDPSGRHWRFPTTCIPQGWRMLDPSPADVAAAGAPLCTEPPVTPGGCEARSLPSCGGAGCRAAVARRVDLDKVCVGSEAQVGCVVSTCGDGALTYAKDPGGQVWQFSDACIPVGWTRIEILPEAIQTAERSPRCQP
jgi:hypothetical protein